MTTEKKIEKLESIGWKLSFDEVELQHVAERGIIEVKAKNITNLYDSIKYHFN